MQCIVYCLNDEYMMDIKLDKIKSKETVGDVLIIPLVSIKRQYLKS